MILSFKENMYTVDGYFNNFLWSDIINFLIVNPKKIHARKSRDDPAIQIATIFFIKGSFLLTKIDQINMETPLR